LPLYRVWGQGTYKLGGSLDRREVNLREGLANLAWKLCHLVEHDQGWLSSLFCGHVVAWCGVVLLRRSWWHCRHGGGAPAILCNMVSSVVFVIISWFPDASYKSW
jgi:uncharacterized membrane protein YeaQ/YmgE (transglycosylase-associated protein family)